MTNLHGIIFAYHSNDSLGELSKPRNTCSLPYGGRYRLIDFMRPDSSVPSVPPGLPASAGQKCR